MKIFVILILVLARIQTTTVGSAVKNGVDAIRNFMKGNVKEGFISVAKAAIDVGSLYLKANPVGMVVSIGLSILTSWW